jgi:hypothetical protein
LTTGFDTFETTPISKALIFALLKASEAERKQVGEIGWDIPVAVITRGPK